MAVLTVNGEMVKGITSAVWHSPMENPVLTRDREQAIDIIRLKMTRLRNRLREEKKDPKFSFHWCAIPVGSIVYGRANFTEQQEHISDWDYVVYSDNEEIQTILKEERRRMHEMENIDVVDSRSMTYDPINGSAHGDMFGQVIRHDLYNGEDTPAAATLFIPDQYIAGDLNMAKAIRKGYVRVLQKFPIGKGGPEYAYRQLKAEFFKHFVNIGRDKRNPFDVRDGAKTEKQAEIDRVKGRNRVLRFAAEAGNHHTYDPSLPARIIKTLCDKRMEDNLIMVQWPSLEEFIAEMEANDYAVSCDSTIGKGIWMIGGES